MPRKIEDFALFRPSEFYDVVSGRRRGVVADALRCALRIGEWFYTAAVRRRNRRYDRGAAVCRVDASVVSVGNLTLGGTGKTPMVRWIAQWFAERGDRVAVVSRGYGTSFGLPNDEALELAKLLPEVPHLQNPDRVAAAQRAIEKFQSQWIVLDDGFQHRRIGRDLDIVLLDALEPFGFGHVFPRGAMREPIDGLRRADVVVLSRADRLDSAGRAAFWQTVGRHAPDATRAEVSHVPQRLIATTGTATPLSSVRGRSIAAFCGIGNPAGFRHTLDACGCRVVDFREFPDHHPYTRTDVDSLSAWAAGQPISAVLCTMKDLVKLPVEQLGGRPLLAIVVGLEFLAGQEPFEARLSGLALR
jgi:tetraacyldisaccharide 4'-kinase